MFLSKFTTPVLRLPRSIKRLMVLSLDVSLCLLSVSIAFYLRVGEWVPLFSRNEWTPLIAAEVGLLLSIPIFIFSGLYREIFRHSGWPALISLIRAMSIYGLFFILIFTLMGVNGVPRTVGFIQPIILLMLVGASRAFASYWLSNAYRNHLNLSSIPHVLIYGAGDAGRQLMAALSHGYEMQVVGFLDDDQRLHGNILCRLKAPPCPCRRLQP